MQYVSEKSYSYFQHILVSMSALVLAAYTLLRFVPLLAISPELLGLSTVSAAVAAVHLLYSIFLYQLVGRLSQRTATLISLILVAAATLSIIQNSGQFGSPYFSLWILLILFAGIFGGAALLSSTFLVSLYFVLLSAPAEGRGLIENSSFIYLLASYAAALVSYLLWRPHYQPPEHVGHVEHLTNQLSEEQLRSQILLHSIGDGIIVVNGEQKIQFLNPAAERITGWKAADAGSLDYQLVLPLTTEEDKPLKSETNPVSVAFKTKESLLRSDVILHTKSDRKKNLSLSVSPVLSGSGEVTGAIIIFRDISEEKQLERERSEFISTASHEMRTPIAALEGFLSLALNDKVAKIDSNARKYLEKAHDETKHLGELFRDLLSVTKLGEGKVVSRPEPINAGELITVTIDEMQFAADKKGIDLTFKKPADKSVDPLYYMYADPQRIREVLSNLIDNAIKFTEKGTVEVSLSGDQESVTIGVHDTGVGIAPEDASHLFQKFYRADNSQTRVVGGTGLGLYICRTIIELYNGRIWVESEPGKGSHFYFRLPRLAYEKVQELTKTPHEA